MMPGPEPAGAGGSVVELLEVWREYPAGVKALRGVSLRIGHGQLVAIVGRSGSGKTTLLHLMGTLDRPTAGMVRIDGYDVSRLRDRELSALRGRRIGFVFQQFHLPVGISALDIVADGLLYSGLPLRHRRQRAAETLERLGLAHRLGHRQHQLSGGERQRVAIGRAMVRAPALLLADEPTGNLDSQAGDELLDLLLGLNATGAAVIVVTHDKAIASRMPRRVEIGDGRVVSDTVTPGEKVSHVSPSATGKG